MNTTTSQQAEQAASFLGCPTEGLINPFDLSHITSSKQFPPQKIVIYGVPGIGKTTFAATFPAPILVRTEDGASAMDVPTFPRVVTALSELDAALTALQGNHQFKTLILDSLDWLEPHVWRWMCKQEGKINIEDFGYGKGYVKVDDVWRRIQAKLDALRSKRGMHVIAIAHAVPVTYDPPDTDSYQRYTLKLHKRGAALWMEWADMILFLNYKTHVMQKEGSRAMPKGSGDRTIYTTERPAWQAKCRWPLTDEIFVGIDPTWAAFHEQLSEATEGNYHA